MPSQFRKMFICVGGWVGGLTKTTKDYALAFAQYLTNLLWRIYYIVMASICLVLLTIVIVIHTLADGQGKLVLQHNTLMICICFCSVQKWNCTASKIW